MRHNIEISNVKIGTILLQQLRDMIIGHAARVVLIYE